MTERLQPEADDAEFPFQCRAKVINNLGIDTDSRHQHEVQAAAFAQSDSPTSLHEFRSKAS